ncbi:hypothetical protein BJI69_20600 [Luteibacter rhizovicinus DSM 16549]|uniref:Uncharacterized protein n=1 Tax=Luteibacter rhizovicinus DSM 16549 TaxID=1440763 RepID=A0A0G9HKT5_9GAMM|nr:hypothetical protein [Luteibacter rhizovicinus]APG06061.1 hypothetical protein BJI69_20600 [Luteibacter rhizovicinus DSM 16549]KLD68292.1 hypothetical protein Y883_03255 [Luteibacter rhizovicinus DSM 16549]KLD75431.1 hypothetical protein Y886_27080 [Xanthomonas hyacinthi DSM 19077]
MSQLIEFLGKVGSDANLRYGGRDALLQAMDAEGLDLALREPVAAGDVKAMKLTLQGNAAMTDEFRAVQMVTAFHGALMISDFQASQILTDFQATQMGTEFQPR